jgi:hypothetical protein
VNGRDVRTTEMRSLRPYVGSDSNVFRPIITICPIVACLKNFKSSGICQGSRFWLPIMPFFEIATRAFILCVVENLYYMAKALDEIRTHPGLCGIIYQLSNLTIYFFLFYYLFFYLFYYLFF